MSALPLSRVSEFVQVAEAAELLGVSPGAVCRQLGLPFWHDYDPDGLMPARHIRRLKDGVARAAGSPTFGLAMMEVVPLQRMGRLGCGIARAETVYQALRAAVRLMPGHSNVRQYWLREADAVVWLCRGSDRLADPGEAVSTQYALRGMIQLVQRGVGASWWPERIVLQAGSAAALPPAPALGGVTPRHHPEITAIAVPREFLPWPIRQRDPAPPPPPLGPLRDERGFLATAPAETLVPALKQLIATLLPRGYPSIEAMAGIVGVHPRTLQRSLQERAISYRQLVDEVRSEQATVLLQGSDAPVTEIAFDLGYTDVSHFIRAFRRWTGVSPSRYRNVRAAA